MSIITPCVYIIPISGKPEQLRDADLIKLQVPGRQVEGRYFQFKCYLGNDGKTNIFYLPSS
jgi:hypothetical protein